MGGRIGYKKHLKKEGGMLERKKVKRFGKGGEWGRSRRGKGKMYRKFPAPKPERKKCLAGFSFADEKKKKDYASGFFYGRLTKQEKESFLDEESNLLRKLIPQP